MPQSGLQARLFQALAALAEEVWIMKDRQRVTEAVLAKHGLDIAEEVDLFQPDEALAEALDAERERFIAAVLGAFADGDDAADGRS